MFFFSYWNRFYEFQLLEEGEIGEWENMKLSFFTSFLIAFDKICGILSISVLIIVKESKSGDIK